MITGNSGDNILDGGTGADRLAGEAGNDTYLVDNAGDIVTENSDVGVDSVKSSIAYALGSNVENLTLTGSIALNGTGNALDNVLIGNNGDNILDGRGGNDTFSGGAGNDSYIVDSATDLVTENANEGIDSVLSSITYTLLGTNLENLTLTGSDTLNGTGNNLDNILIGNSGANILTGGAGNDTLDGLAGADTMLGGLGDDTYFVDVAKDSINESVNEGIDTVQSSITYSLGANIENLTLTGIAHIVAIGNELDNQLIGNSGNNLLSGGIGADTLIGGRGIDTYYVDNVGDIVVENSNEGIDIVQSTVTYTLGNNIENLFLTDTANINGSGNELDNVIYGNSGMNILTGGAGNDTLNGGAGDTLLGGLGNDIYAVGDSSVVIIETANEGIDLVQSTISYTLSANIENLTLNYTAINGTGNELDNLLIGNSSDNILNGGIGVDTLRGGLGDDTYFADNAGDIIVENSAEGIDTVQSSISYILEANLEDLTLLGADALKRYRQRWQQPSHR